MKPTDSQAGLMKPTANNSAVFTGALQIQIQIQKYFIASHLQLISHIQYTMHKNIN